MIANINYFIIGNKYINPFDYNQALIGFTNLISIQYENVKPSKQIWLDVISTLIMCRTADTDLVAPFGKFYSKSSSIRIQTYSY